MQLTIFFDILGGFNDMKDDCIFCKLANGVFATNYIYEDEDFKIILDAAPATKGHALVLPKEHYANLYEMPENLLSKLMVLAKEQVLHMKDILKAEGFNLVQNNGEVAGQTVHHFHLHLIPRYSDDNQKISWNPTEPNADVQKQLAESLMRK